MILINWLFSRWARDGKTVLYKISMCLLTWSIRISQSYFLCIDLILTINKLQNKRYFDFEIIQNFYCSENDKSISFDSFDIFIKWKLGGINPVNSCILTKSAVVTIAITMSKPVWGGSSSVASAWMYEWTPCGTPVLGEGGLDQERIARCSTGRGISSRSFSNRLKSTEAPEEDTGWGKQGAGLRLSCLRIQRPVVPSLYTTVS